ncbi:hypothetical protein CDEST_04905 [Colletotrichum destructivum]|uniref:Uncharacterized protein n=1 Tax=Colletotrichum destructivum TaxID=34406 RepID=A0AAX4I9M6_9PEZI|nr:hypothetical protein CDEST_04905 [Colletotrichum destructivum]
MEPDVTPPGEGSVGFPVRGLGRWRDQRASRTVWTPVSFITVGDRRDGPRGLFHISVPKECRWPASGWCTMLKTWFDEVWVKWVGHYCHFHPGRHSHRAYCHYAIRSMGLLQ